MPATAGRVRMPANNRVHSSAALQTHGIWQSAIGYDPYAPVNNKKESKPDYDPENAYASFKGLLALARITSGGSNSDGTRGACRKCGRIGHLTYQCRNFLSLKDEKEGDDSALRAANAVFEKIKKAKTESEDDDGDESESESESESSDSSVDPEIERIIEERFGKPMSKKVGSLKKRSNSSSGDDDDEEGKHKHKRGRHRHRRKKRRDSDGDESDSDRNQKRRRRGERRMSDSESSSDESDGHRGRRRSRRRKERRSVLSSDSESTASSSDEDERRKRREKRRRRRGHKREQRH